jgi:hypothetical protein
MRTTEIIKIALKFEYIFRPDKEINAIAKVVKGAFKLDASNEMVINLVFDQLQVHSMTVSRMRIKRMVERLRLDYQLKKQIT